MHILPLHHPYNGVVHSSPENPFDLYCFYYWKQEFKTLDWGSVFSNPCESELTCFRPESTRRPYGLPNFLNAALSTTELWWRMNHRKSFRTLFAGGWNRDESWEILLTWRKCGWICSIFVEGGRNLTCSHTSFFQVVVFTHFFFPFHPLADFIYLYISFSPIYFSCFTLLQISLTCRLCFHLLLFAVSLICSEVKIAFIIAQKEIM